VSREACLPNNTFDRTAGSPSLAAAGQRGRSAAIHVLACLTHKGA